MPTVTIPHGTIHYRESGSGAPIVFLHGYLMDGRLWDPVVRLLDGDYRCITPDLRSAPEHAERLSRILPNARVEKIQRSRTWVMLDQPERTAELVRELVREPVAGAR